VLAHIIPQSDAEKWRKSVPLVPIASACCTCVPGVLPLLLSTIDNHIWRTYRPVAHLWGAYHLQAQAYTVADIPVAFPCYPHEVLQFLAMAEVLRKKAECCLLAHGGTLIDPLTSWHAPSDIDLPSMEVRFA
jgi:hypothetical protein